MKSGKAPGADGITAEMLKADVYVTAPMLTEIFSQDWEPGKLPDACKTGLIFKLPKSNRVVRGCIVTTTVQNSNQKGRNSQQVCDPFILVRWSRLRHIARGARGRGCLFFVVGFPCAPGKCDLVELEVVNC
ncbi:hypothetical protein C0Q70_18430 [Pomacea canaliculata]|uniref:Reverse transcriptase domain-containing protein n=1 Tax=Pomacea canaliculata TaxID=400727 RepID=A0A2T7NN64_POMCA|nr:hypothetical protein C0Q70_18430 [Pomacea canaliculata]